jgi:hypothetical protein
MTNVFKNHKPKIVYDLKGSEIGRCATEEEKKNEQTLKDLDFLENKQNIDINDDLKNLFIKQISKDTLVLFILIL